MRSRGSRQSHGVRNLHGETLRHSAVKCRQEPIHAASALRRVLKGRLPTTHRARRVLTLLSYAHDWRRVEGFWSAVTTTTTTTTMSARAKISDSKHRAIDRASAGFSVRPVERTGDAVSREQTSLLRLRIVVCTLSGVRGTSLENTPFMRCARAKPLHLLGV